MRRKKIRKKEKRERVGRILLAPTHTGKRQRNETSILKFTFPLPKYHYVERIFGQHCANDTITNAKTVLILSDYMRWK